MNDSFKNIEVLKNKILAGDANALGQLYKSYFGKLKAYGFQFSQKLDSFSVDDSIQELFIWIAKNPETLKSVDNLEVYLFSALKQNIYQEISKKEIKKKVRNRFLQYNTTELVEASVEKKIIASQEHANNSTYVYNLLNTLPPNQKEVLYLRNYVNMSHREIAEVMNLSEQVVRNYSYRAIQKLRAKTSLNSRQGKVL